MWSLDPRDEAQYQRYLVQLYQLCVTRDTNRIDFDQVASLAREHKPKLIVAGASAYPREIPHDRFADIAHEVGAKLFVDMAHYSVWLLPDCITTQFLCGFCFDDHTQDPARTTIWLGHV